MKKNTLHTQTNKSNQKKDNEEQKSDPKPSILSTGIIDLTLRFNFSDKDLEKSEENENNENNTTNTKSHYSIHNIKTISDLEFIKDRKEIWDKIQLIPNNATLKHLLLANVMRRKKVITEYIGFGRPSFTNDEKFFEEIFTYVSKKNNIIFNKKPLDKDIECHLNFELCHKKKYDHFEVQRSGGESKNEKDENDKQNKEKNKPDFTRNDSFFKRIDLLNTKYNLFYLNYQDFENFTNKFERIDLIDLIYFLRKRGTKIFINFYKEEKIKTEESVKEKDNDITSEHFNGQSIYNEESDNEEEEEEEEEPTDEKTKKMNDINNIYYFTDLYFFDTKQAPKKFNKHYNFFTADKKKSAVNKGNLYDYFIKGIATGTKDVVDKEKYGFFIEYFNKLYIVKADKNIGNKYEFDLKIYPHINIHNMDTINIYKDIIKKNKNYYISLILAYTLGSMIEDNSTNIETIFKGYAYALEAIKKKLEFEKNNLNEKEDDDYKNKKIKITDNFVDIKIKTLQNTGQENGFILDCTNKKKSELKDYVPLYDIHMVNFLKNKNLDDLKKKGFINDKGFIMIDPQYRNRMKDDAQVIAMNKKKFNKNIENKIKNINILKKESDRLKDPKKEVKDAFEINIPTNKKIPKAKMGPGAIYNISAANYKTKKIPKNIKNSKKKIVVNTESKEVKKKEEIKKEEKEENKEEEKKDEGKKEGTKEEVKEEKQKEEVK